MTSLLVALAGIGVAAAVLFDNWLLAVGVLLLLALVAVIGDDRARQRGECDCHACTGRVYDPLGPARIVVHSVDSRSETQFTRTRHTDST